MKIKMEKDHTTAVAAPPISKGRTRRQLKREQQAGRYALYFVLPALLFLLLLNAFPLGQVVWDSFQYRNMVNAAERGFAGLANFVNVLNSEYIVRTFWNTVLWTVLSVVGEFIAGIITALALNQPVRGRAFFRGIIIVPWVVPIVVAGMMWTWLLTPEYGIVNSWLVKLGIIDKPYYWLGEMNTALLAITFVNIWRSFPFYTISLLAGLQSVSREVLEAAAIDGAGIMTRFWRIVMPQLKTVSLTLIFMHIIWTAINFDFIWIMTQGGPYYASETLPITIYRYAMKEFDMGAASALSSMMLGFMMIVVALFYMSTMKKQREEG
ncbi:carbohydrate ABC transporter permease [Paenibacillus sp. sgz302251]|uniref:carbohydrate ABC transporter permease n=1 Tax=Paenibacillus sp. sgz302251 TaxID=3414493 RepID=UPI003C7CB828